MSAPAAYPSCTIDTRVHVTMAWLARLAAGGCDVARYDGPATVLEIESNERYGWTSVLVRFDDGCEATFCPETLAVAS